MYKRSPLTTAAKIDDWEQAIIEYFDGKDALFDTLRSGSDAKKEVYSKKRDELPTILVLVELNQMVIIVISHSS